MIAEIDPVRLERVHAIRDALTTDADCAALAKRIDDEFSGLAMRMIQLRPEKRDVIGRKLNDARIAIWDTIQFVGIEVAP